MTREEAKQYIRTMKPDFLTLDKTGKGYVCPCCGSGSGKKGTGMQLKRAKKTGAWYAVCYAGHDVDGKDAFGLYGLVYGVESFKDQFNALVARYNLQIDDERKISPEDRFPLTKKSAALLGFLPHVTVTKVIKEVPVKESKNKYYEIDSPKDDPNHDTIFDPYTEVEYQYISLESEWAQDKEGYDYMFSERTKWALKVLGKEIDGKKWLYFPMESKQYYVDVLTELEPLVERYKLQVPEPIVKFMQEERKQAGREQAENQPAGKEIAGRNGVLNSDGRADANASTGDGSTTRDNDITNGYDNTNTRRVSNTGNNADTGTDGRTGFHTGSGRKDIRDIRNIVRHSPEKMRAGQMVADKTAWNGR